MNVLTVSHSWKGLHGHFMRAGKKIKRCLIGDIDMTDTQILGIWVTFQINGRKKKKKIDPMELAVMDVTWWNMDVVSEEDEDVETNKFFVAPPMIKLPPWNVPNLETIAPNKKEAIDFRVSSINKYLDLFETD